MSITGFPTAQHHRIANAKAAARVAKNRFIS